MIEPDSGGFVPGGNTARHAAVQERLVPNPKARLKEQFHEVCRFKHLAVRSEEACWGWVVRYLRFLRFHRGKAESGKQKAETGGWRHPRDLGATDVVAFLNHLASVECVAAATQNQALNAISFLYTEVLRLDLGDLGEFHGMKSREDLAGGHHVAPERSFGIFAMCFYNDASPTGLKNPCSSVFIRG